jgi:hypothetical protein
MIYRNGRMVSSEFAQLIEQSRQADRDEIGHKAEICRRIGIDVAALKGDGFATYFVDTDLLLAAMEDVMGEKSMLMPAIQNWSFHSSRPEIIDRLAEMDASVAKTLPRNGTFIAF